MVNNEVISAAIADLKLQKKPNYNTTAKKFKINKIILRRRFNGQQAPKSINQLNNQKYLLYIIKQIFINRINILSTYKIFSIF